MTISTCTTGYYLVLLIPPLLILFRRGGLMLRTGVVLALLSPWVFHSLPDSRLEALLVPLYVLGLWGTASLLSSQTPNSRTANAHR